MGCSYSNDEWKAEMEENELAIFESVEGLDMGKLTRKYVTIEMNG